MSPVHNEAVPSSINTRTAHSENPGIRHQVEMLVQLWTLSSLLGGGNDTVCNTTNIFIMRDKPIIAVYFAQFIHSIGTYNLKMLLVLKYEFIHKNKIKIKFTCPDSLSETVILKVNVP